MRIIYNHSIFNGILYNRLEKAFSSLLVLIEQSSLQNISLKKIFIFTGHSRRMEGWIMSHQKTAATHIR